MSRYLKLARQAVTREERPETAEQQVLRGGSVYPPISESPALAHKLDDSYREPDAPVTERDKSDQSSDYRAVAEVLRDPPYWLRDSYMVGYQCGTLGLHALSAAVAAAMGRSPYAWVERLKPVVEQVLKKRPEATDVNGYFARTFTHPAARGAEEADAVRSRCHQGKEGAKN